MSASALWIIARTTAADDWFPPFRDLELISCGGHFVRNAAVELAIPYNNFECRVWENLPELIERQVWAGFDTGPLYVESA